MDKNELRKLAREIVTPGSGCTAKEYQLAKAIVWLLDRPVTSCFDCEQLNEQLSQELDTIDRWKVAKERESLAWNTWLEAAGLNEWETEEEMREWMKGDSPKFKEARAKFEEWWDNNKFFQ